MDYRFTSTRLSRGHVTTLRPAFTGATVRGYRQAYFT